LQKLSRKYYFQHLLFVILDTNWLCFSKLHLSRLDGIKCIFVLTYCIIKCIFRDKRESKGFKV